MLRPNFVRDQISDLDMEERHVEHLIAELPAGESGWTDFTDIQTLFFRLTIDAATEFLFGDSVNSQVSEGRHSVAAKPGSQTRDEKAFSVNFDQAQLHMTKKFRLGDFHWWHNPKEYKVNNKIVNDFVRTYVDMALGKRPSSDIKKAEEGQGDKEKYVFLEELVKKTRDPDELRAQLLNILLAGRDTTVRHVHAAQSDSDSHRRFLGFLAFMVLPPNAPQPRYIRQAKTRSCQHVRHPRQPARHHFCDSQELPIPTVLYQ